MCQGTCRGGFQLSVGFPPRVSQGKLHSLRTCKLQEFFFFITSRLWNAQSSKESFVTRAILLSIFNLLFVYFDHNSFLACKYMF